MTSQEKLIGKTILDKSGMTEFFGGEINVKDIKPLPIYVDRTDWENFESDINRLEKDPVQVDIYLKTHGLDKVEGLRDYILNNDIKQDSVNNLIQTQNYKNIADQAHGFTGVKKAINSYNEGIKNGTLNAEKFTETISQSNSSLGKYLTGLNGATAGMGKYALSLTTAALKTFVLKAATMALNMAVSMGVSFVISGIITAITNYVNRIDDAIEASHKAKEAIDEINSTLKSQQDLIKESGQKYAELAQHVNLLNNTNLDLHEDEYESFLELSNQIAEQFPSLIKGYDDNGNAILNLNGTVSDITSTLDTYIETAKEASQIKIVHAFKGEGGNEDYFKGTKYEIDESKSKTNQAKKTKENLQKFKEGNLQTDDPLDLFGNYSNGSDSRFKADYIRKYLEVSGFDKRKLNDISTSMLFSGVLPADEHKILHDAINEFSLNGELSDNSVLNIDEILSKYSKESGYNISDYIAQQIKVATDDYKQFSKDLETKNKEISQNAQAVLEQSVIWSDPDTTDQMKTTMTNALSQIDWSDAQFEGFDGEQAAHYIQTVFASSFEKLNDDDKITVDRFFDADPNKVDLTEYIDLYEKIKEIFKKQGIDIPINIENIQNVEDKFNESLEQMSDKDKETVKKYLTDNSIDSAPELDVWNKRTEGITNATEAISAYEKKAQEVSQISLKDTTLSFKEAWKAIGTSGDEKADKKAKEAKEELLELAKAGKLTEDAFSKSTIAENFLKQTKLSAREATQEINELVSSADQLSSMKTGISSISTILGEKKENQSSKKTRTKGIGADTLAGMPEDIKKQKKEYEHFVEVLGDGSSKMEDCKDAANKLATAYVTSGNFLSNLTDENKNYYKSVLDEMGVKNAAEIVDKTAIANKEVLDYKTQALQAATKDMAGETSNASQKFLEEANMTSLAKTELADLVAQQQVFSSTELNTADKINELNRLAEAYFGVSNAITLASGMGADPRYYTEETIKKQWEKLLKKKTKVAVGEVDVKANTSKSKSGNGKGSKSKSKQQFDWISRALDRLSSKLDLVKAKYDSLFTGKKIKDSDSLLKKQNKNLDKQYKLLQKTGKYQDSARKKYTEKANRVRISKNKKENASLKKAVRDGRINSKSMKKLIATYGEKKAEKIQKYQDWYDKMPLCLVISIENSI